VKSTRRAAGCAALLITLALPAAAAAQARPTAVAVTRSIGDLRAWDARLDQMLRDRDLRIRDVQPDALAPDRTHQRLDQYFHSLRIVGGDLTRQMAPDGTVSVFGIVYTDLALDTEPALSAEGAAAAIAAAAGGRFRGGDPELVVLPLSDGIHLAYFGQAITDVEIVNVYVDANTGTPLRQDSDFRKDVGLGKGTYGDDKKISTTAASGAFVTDDKLRPASITTFDLKGNLGRTQTLLAGVEPASSDMASSTSNTNWTDGAVVDAHVYAGWYYDYLFKRFNRHGIDDRDLRMPLFTHTVKLADIGTASPTVVSTFYLNAFYCPTCGTGARGAMVLGEGAPRGFIAPNVEVKPFSAALDVVAHELTHGVTAATARLGGAAENGALNEAFSDVIGASTAFFYQPAGSSP
jgi:Zn-dependent metalloprotease